MRYHLQRTFLIVFKLIQKEVKTTEVVFGRGGSDGKWKVPAIY